METLSAVGYQNGFNPATGRDPDLESGDFAAMCRKNCDTSNLSGIPDRSPEMSPIGDESGNHGWIVP
jgi:hypothetical protein